MAKVQKDEYTTVSSANLGFWERGEGGRRWLAHGIIFCWSGGAIAIHSLLGGGGGGLGACPRKIWISKIASGAVLE